MLMDFYFLSFSSSSGWERCCTWNTCEWASIFFLFHHPQVGKGAPLGTLANGLPFSLFFIIPDWERCPTWNTCLWASVFFLFHHPQVGKSAPHGTLDNANELLFSFFFVILRLGKKVPHLEHLLMNFYSFSFTSSSV